MRIVRVKIGLIRALKLFNLQFNNHYLAEMQLGITNVK